MDACAQIIVSMPHDDRSKLYIMMDERQSIKDSLKCLRKYGSTSNNNYSKFPSEFIKHIVTDSDTLQGIALKYGVSTEQIRRANKMWANDSLFLRESLLIPVKSKSLPSTSMSSFDSPSEPDLFMNQSIDDIKASQNGFCRSDSTRSSSSSYRNDEDLNNVDKFLNRIDSDIANKTQQVKLTQTKSSFAPDITDSSVRRKPAMSRLKQQQHRVFDTDQIIPEVASVPQNKKVKNSLQRLRDSQDEIFEL